MKKILLILLLLLTGCSKPVSVQMNLTEVSQMLIGQAVLPQMLSLSEEVMENLCGISPEDWVQGAVYLCADSLRADEIWLLEAKDTQALQHLRAAAEKRLQQKAAESKTYSPEQYAVVQQAKIMIWGNYFALLVSPQAEALAQYLDWEK